MPSSNPAAPPDSPTGMLCAASERFNESLMEWLMFSGILDRI